MLDLLNLKGCVVTIDAMGCQKDIATKIREKEADYVLALKGNQSSRRDDVQLYLEDAQKNAFKDVPHSSYIQVEKGHGRIDIRRYWTTDAIDFLDQKEEWKDLKTMVWLSPNGRHPCHWFTVPTAKSVADFIAHAAPTT